MANYYYIDELLKELKSDKEETVINAINDIIAINERLVYSLLKLLNDTSNSKIRDKVALVIIDHFKGPNIVTTFLNLIQRLDLKEHNAFLLYACGEYSDCKEHLELLVEFVLNYDYHIAWNAYNIIINMPPPFKKELVSKILNRIISSEEQKDKKEIINGLIKFFKAQLPTQRKPRL